MFNSCLWLKYIFIIVSIEIGEDFYLSEQGSRYANRFRELLSSVVFLIELKIFLKCRQLYEMWKYFFLIARESKSISELMPPHLAYEKYNYAQRYNMSGLSDVTPLLVTAVCLMAVVHLIGVRKVLPAVSRGHSSFRLMGCHLCPSYRCCPLCSIQAVLCPGGTSCSSRWHGRWWSQKLEKLFDILPGCPSSSSRASSSKGEGDLDPCPPNNPSSRRILPPRMQVMSLASWLRLQPHAAHSTISFLTTTSYNYLYVRVATGSCCMVNWLWFLGLTAT